MEGCAQGYLSNRTGDRKTMGAGLDQLLCSPVVGRGHVRVCVHARERERIFVMSLKNERKKREKFREVIWGSSEHGTP